jgi:hypothetical protein
MTNEFTHARAIALVLAYMDGDREGVNVLLADVVPPVRDADEDPLGAAMDHKRADPVQDLINQLVGLVMLWAKKAHGGSEEAALATLRDWLGRGRPT